MLKIILCCGGGFSSSAIAARMQKEIEQRGLQNEYSIDFYPLEVAGERYAENKLNQYDIAILCPHLKMVIARILKTNAKFNMPIYLLPPKIYGNMKLDVILADCEDIIELYKNGAENPVHFPGEENLLRITRGVAYRDLKK